MLVRWLQYPPCHFRMGPVTRQSNCMAASICFGLAPAVEAVWWDWALNLWGLSSLGGIKSKLWVVEYWLVFSKHYSFGVWGDVQEGHHRSEPSADSGKVRTGQKWSFACRRLVILGAGESSVCKEFSFLAAQVSLAPYQWVPRSCLCTVRGP